MLGVNMAVDVTTPRGWVDPLEPYGPAPTPTVASLNPTSRVVAPTDDLILHVIGTNFIKGSIIYFGASSDGERTTYVSEDRADDDHPGRSVHRRRPGCAGQGLERGQDVEQRQLRVHGGLRWARVTPSPSSPCRSMPSAANRCPTPSSPGSPS